jgi:hypothetical protein
MDEFLERDGTPNLNQKYVNNINIMCNEQWDWSNYKGSPNKVKPKTRGIHCRILPEL